ncbi:hypothetical protein SNUCP4_31350 [Clostridium perfringens A]
MYKYFEYKFFKRLKMMFYNVLKIRHNKVTERRTNSEQNKN